MLFLLLSLACTGATDDSGDDTPSLLVLNEYMASNASTVADESGAFPDWVELYNGGDEEVSLGGYTITDDVGEPDKQVLSEDLSIAAGGFLLLWADGDTLDGADHLSFKLSAAGEDLALFDPDGEELDATSWTDAVTDQSQARTTDGGGEWAASDTPTPGASNN